MYLYTINLGIFNLNTSIPIKIISTASLQMPIYRWSKRILHLSLHKTYDPALLYRLSLFCKQFLPSISCISLELFSQSILRYFLSHCIFASLLFWRTFHFLYYPVFPVYIIILHSLILMITLYFLY